MGGYRVNTTEQYASDLYTFLKEFYNKFTHPLIKNPLFLSGESYAGHYVPALAELILQN